MCTISWMGLGVLSFCENFQGNLSMCVLILVQHMENQLACLIEVQELNVITRSPLWVDLLYFVLKHILNKKSQHFCERPIGNILIGSSGLINSQRYHHLIPIYDCFNIGYLFYNHHKNVGIEVSYKVFPQDLVHCMSSLLQGNHKCTSTMQMLVGILRKWWKSRDFMHQYMLYQHYLSIVRIILILPCPYIVC